MLRLPNAYVVMGHRALGPVVEHQVEHAPTRGEAGSYPERKSDLREAGSGQAILLLHDGLVHSVGMDSLFHGLARHYRVIRYDRRGYGRSDRPTERYSPVADALAVLDHLRVDGAVLLGASAGGGGAIEIALAHPDRVSALVLVGAVYGQPDALRRLVVEFLSTQNRTVGRP